MTKEYNIAVIPGDGIGPEVTTEAVRVLDELPLNFRFTYADVGVQVFEQEGVSVMSETIDLVKRSDSCLFGATTTPADIDGYKSAIITLRKELDLFANLRPIKSIRGLSSKLGNKEVNVENVDLIVVRENTEGLYIGIGERDDRSANDVKYVSRYATERIINKGIELAKERGSAYITVLHKANILRNSDRLFLDVAKEITTREQLGIQPEIIDSFLMNLMQHPQNYNLIVAPNFYGDISSDVASLFMGGLGLAHSGNIGEKYSLFEPIHGTYPQAAGLNIANPMAEILSASYMVRHLGHKNEADQIRNSVERVILDGKTLPKDLGGTAKTTEVTDAIITNLRDELD